MNSRNPLIFYYFFIQAKFHEVTKYIILYSKVELLQPSESLIEN